MGIHTTGDGWLYTMGDRVRKKSGASWQGHVVGFYTTEFTPRGYNVESEREVGSTQLYPEAALEFVPADTVLVKDVPTTSFKRFAINIRNLLAVDTRYLPFVDRSRKPADT